MRKYLESPKISRPPQFDFSFFYPQQDYSPWPNKKNLTAYFSLLYNRI